MNEFELDCSEDYMTANWAINEFGGIAGSEEIFDICASIGWI